MWEIIIGVVVIFILWCFKHVFLEQDELSEKSILKLKKDELDAASMQWKSRVEKSDAEKFSVAGRMKNNKEESNSAINIAVTDNNNKRTPQAKRFKGKEGTVHIIENYFDYFIIR